MTLESNAGWNFWIREGDRVRLFTVANTNRSAAEDLALARTKHGVVLSHQEIGEATISLIKLPFGKVMEWAPKAIA